jgi:hypothetical protein
MEEHVQEDVGLWIDHREAVIVVVSASGEETKRIVSNMEKHVRFSGAAAEGSAGEDVRDRKFGNHLNSFYDEVIANIRDANSLQIFGPGEAKGKVINVETVDKMTERQIAAKVRNRLNHQQDIQMDGNHRAKK